MNNWGPKGSINEAVRCGREAVFHEAVPSPLDGCGETELPVSQQLDGSPAPTLCPPAGLPFLGTREAARAQDRVVPSGLEASVLASAGCRPDFPSPGRFRNPQGLGKFWRGQFHVPNHGCLLPDTSCLKAAKKCRWLM